MKRTRFVNDDLRRLYELNRETYEEELKKPEVEYLSPEETRRAYIEGRFCSCCGL